MFRELTAEEVKKYSSSRMDQYERGEKGLKITVKRRKLED